MVLDLQCNPENNNKTSGAPTVQVLKHTTRDKCWNLEAQAPWNNEVYTLPIFMVGRFCTYHHKWHSFLLWLQQRTTFWSPRWQQCCGHFQICYRGHRAELQWDLPSSLSSGTDRKPGMHKIQFMSWSSAGFAKLVALKTLFASSDPIAKINFLNSAQLIAGWF